MEKDYYAILNIPENSSQQQITEAYKIYATKSHPQNPSETIEHLPGLSKSEVWLLVNEAYDVLSNPPTKDVFDRYGAEGLMKGTAYDDPYVYHGDPMQTYNGVFAFERPKKKDANLEIVLPLDIREVYHGTVKVVQILRRDYDAIGDKTVLHEHRLIMPVEAGISSGTKYLFREEGDQGTDVVFKVKDMDDTVYRRDGLDLHMNYPIDLIDALCGFAQPLPVRTLDDRQFNIMLTDVVGTDSCNFTSRKNSMTLVPNVPQLPNHKPRMHHEGLPMEHDSKVRGDLYIHFNIKFPTYIPPPIKRELRKLLQKCTQ